MELWHRFLDWYQSRQEYDPEEIVRAARDAGLLGVGFGAEVVQHQSGARIRCRATFGHWQGFGWGGTGGADGPS